MSTDTYAAAKLSESPACTYTPCTAGAEAGDGRDESNRSLQERLADAQVQQTAADAEVAEAELAVKHLTKQLAEQRKAAAAKEKEGANLARDLERHTAKVAECNTRLQVRGAESCGGLRGKVLLAARKG